MSASSHHPPQTEPATVRNRHVFYISGFDPRGPSYYHRIYKDGAEKQSWLNKLDLNVGKRTRTGDHAAAWAVDAQADGQSVHTTYEFLRWDDIVRNYWPRNELQLLLVTLRTFRVYITSGALYRILRTTWPCFVTTVYPALFLLAVLGCAAGAAVVSLALLPAWAGILLAPPACYGIILLGRRLERSNNAYWLLRLYAFFVNQADESVPEFDARLDAFADRILAQIDAAENDEVLLIGHSTGAQAAVAVVAAMLKKHPGFAQHGARFALLTLGECIPMLSFLPGARACRDDLAQVCAADDIDWLDFTSAPDGACFALVDPVTVSGITRPANAPQSPKLLSPRFFTLFSPREYNYIKRNRLRIHFQYLMASELAGDYDYFAITAGPQFLAARYRDTASTNDFDRFRI